MQETPPKALSKGALELPKRRKARGHNQRRCAEAVGVTQATVSRWEDGTWNPGAVQRVVLEAIYEIPSFWWEPDAERRRIEAKLRAIKAPAIGLEAKLVTIKPPPRPRARKR